MVATSSFTRAARRLRGSVARRRFSALPRSAGQINVRNPVCHPSRLTASVISAHTAPSRCRFSPLPTEPPDGSGQRLRTQTSSPVPVPMLQLKRVPMRRGTAWRCLVVFRPLRSGDGVCFASCRGSGGRSWDNDCIHELVHPTERLAPFTADASRIAARIAGDAPLAEMRRCVNDSF